LCVAIANALTINLSLFRKTQSSAVEFVKIGVMPVETKKKKRVLIVKTVTRHLKF